MEALIELQSLLEYCPVLLDLEAYKMIGVAGKMVQPHVSSLPMGVLMELQSLLAYCPVLLDLEAYKMIVVAGKMVQATRVFCTYGSPDGTSVPAGILPCTAGS